MSRKIKVFLDTSALFAGIWSSTGASRMILRLGEAEVIRPIVSQRVLHEIERALRRKAPDLLGVLALFLDRSSIEIVPAPPEKTVAKVIQVVLHPGDAEVLSAAIESGVDYFVTLDRVHFLDNDHLLSEVPFPLGTPGNFLDWYRGLIKQGKS